ncbi:Uu.00g065740.m01.CDS01 [Anthostomella pinea]|uniref:Uu.00g065740.m01.CDS01 n=1 Tax=Anthostomella pinea TaxID=933095 RepID=A0AAI8VUL0_9PEZI|nr:Uu.00g065740.m01.CDS01 [Anthostomella pinea]
MTEVSFAKSFLAALDARPIKLSPDHVEDPKSYQRGAVRTCQPNPKSQTRETTTDIPQYTLPKLPKSMSKPKPSTAAPGQERSLTVTVKSLRNPPLDVKLASQGPNTSVLDVKSAVTKQTGIPEDKMKLLHKKKPVPDSKVLKELAGEGETSVEFSVMVMGGAATLAAAAASAGTAAAAVPAEESKTEAQKDVAQGQSGSDTLETQEFWDDLKGFLLQRIRDEKLAVDLTNTFQKSWKAKR